MATLHNGHHGHVHANELDHGHDHAHNDHNHDRGFHDHGHTHMHNHGDEYGHEHEYGHAKTPQAWRDDCDTRIRLSRGKCHGLTAKSKNLEELANKRARCKLWAAALLCFVFMLAEFAGGYFANSLAVMSDAAHLLSDLASFAISIGALYMSTKDPTDRLSYGYHRYEILGAAISVIMIWILTAFLGYEAVMRVLYPEEIDGKIMFIVASSGLVINIMMGYILFSSGHGHNHGEIGGGGECSGHHGHDHDNHSHSHGHSPDAKSMKDVASSKHVYQPLVGEGSDEANINVTAALVHVVGDALQSVGVMIAAGIIWYEPSYHLADPICTFIFCILVIVTTVRLARQATHIFLEGVPKNMSLAEVEERLMDIDGVKEIHDLHVWTLTVGKPAMTAHVIIQDLSMHNSVLQAAQEELAVLGIHHTTLQLEPLDAMLAQKCNYRCNSHTSL